MPKNIFVIAKNTFRSAIRDKILYAVVGFGILYIFLTIFLGALALNDVPMIKTFGLTGIYVFGIMATIFLASSVLKKEIEQRTLYFVLSKPVSHLDVVMGKFFGLYAAVVLMSLVMFGVYAGVVLYQGGGFAAKDILALGFELLEMVILISFSILVSTFTTSFASTLYTVLMVFIGHSLDALWKNVQVQHIGGPMRDLLAAAYYSFPNLEKFNLRDAAVHNLNLSFPALLATVAYAVFYAAFFIWAANMFFKNREI